MGFEDLYTTVNVTCPNCQNHGNAGDDIYSMIDDNITEEEYGSEDKPIRKNAFRPRGQMEGYPIWVCNKCNEGGVWVKPGWFSKFKPLSKNEFQELKNIWESDNGHGTF